MARRSHRLRSRRKPQSWKYIVPVVLIIVLALAIKYRHFGNDAASKGVDPNDINDVSLKSDITEMETKEQELVKEPEQDPLPSACRNRYLSLSLNPRRKQNYL